MMQKYSFLIFPKLKRGYAGVFFEVLEKGGPVGKAARINNGLDGCVSLFEQFYSFFNSALVDVCNRRLSCVYFEDSGEMLRCVSALRRNILNR